MAQQIKLLCKCCGKVHTLPRTNEIPEGVNTLACNWCIECDGKVQDYYEEWYIDESELPPVIDPNQLELFNLK